MFQIQDLKINFGLNENQSNYNDIYSYLLVLDSESIIFPDILKISKTFQWLICGVCWMIIMIGSYFRSILYKYLYKQYKIKESKPIDILTLAVTITHHLSTITHASFLTLRVATDSNLADIIGQGLCPLLKNIIRFEFSYTIAGSLGIAIYRLCYIKFHRFSGKGGEKNTLIYILFGGLAFSIICNILLQSNGFDSTLSNNCIMVYKTSILMFLDEYEMSRGNASIYIHWQIIIVTIGTIGICLTTIRLIIYIYIFYNQYKHDNTESLRRLLDPSVISSRNQKNAITFFGHFCSFLCELAVFIAVIIMSKIQAWYMVFILKYVGFAAISIVEVFTSSVLRSRFFNA